jgi:hypothetical protein
VNIQKCQCPFLVPGLIRRKHGPPYHCQCHIVFLCGVLRLLVTANVVPSLLTVVTLMMEVIHSSESLVLTRAYGLTSQNMAFFIVTTVKTSNLTFIDLFILFGPCVKVKIYMTFFV